MTPYEWEDRWPSKLDNYHYNQTIAECINGNNLLDKWRNLNPWKKQYSWYKPNGTCKSRIDYWFAANSIVDLISDASISKAPLTDHCIIEINLNSANNKRKKQGLLEI